MCLPFRYLGEQCDDMNFANGDGCSNQCKKEPLFNCVGMWPSTIGRNVKGIVHKLCLFLASCQSNWLKIYVFCFISGENKDAQLFSIKWSSKTFRFQYVSQAKLCYGFRTLCFFPPCFGNLTDVVRQFYNCHCIKKSCITILQNTSFCIRQKKQKHMG